MRVSATITLVTRLAAVDDVLAPFAPALGRDFDGYRNHVYRVLNHYLALAGGGAELPQAVALAAPFHDLGIWTAGTFDYLQPSVALAMSHLHRCGLDCAGPEVRDVILQHHRLRPCRGPHARTAELFRRADWIDVSLGLLRFGLPRQHLQAVHAAFPDAGFHRRLAALTARQFVRTPLRPLPMVRW